MNLDVQKDGLTYIITMSMPMGDGEQCWLLREEYGEWMMIASQPYGDSHKLGRRKTWQRAMHDALVYLEEKLNERSRCG